MLHDILHPALEDVAQLVDGVGLHVLVVTQAVELGAVDVIVGVEVILGDAFGFHGEPEAVIFDHAGSLLRRILDFSTLSV